MALKLCSDGKFRVMPDNTGETFELNRETAQREHEEYLRRDRVSHDHNEWVIEQGRIEERIEAARIKPLVHD